MQDITQCKECGHENPKKFMGKEYTSHAPNCPQDIKQLREEFYKSFKDFKELTTIDSICIAGWWLEKLSLAVEQEKERVLAMVLKEIDGIQKAHTENGFGRVNYLDTLKEKLQAKE